MKIKFFILATLCMATISIYAQNFNGLDMNMGNLYRLSNAKTRSISPENFTGEKGKGGMADPITDKEKINQFKRDGFIDRYTGQKLVNPGVLRVMSYYLSLIHI